MSEDLLFPSYGEITPPITDPIEEKRVSTITVDAETRLPVAHDGEVGSAVIERYREVKGKLLEGLESNAEGLDIERTREFVKGFGLRADTDIWVLDEEAYAQFSERRNQYGLPDYEDHGCYLPVADVIVVKRDAEYEEEFGPGFTEYAIVHELAHASVDEESLAHSLSGSEDDQHISADVSRFGQVVLGLNEAGEPEHRGHYLEEGFADMLGKLYVRNELKLPNGFGFDEEPVPVDSGDDKPIELPSQLLNGDAAGRETVAVYGLMYLIDKDPSIMTALVKARRSPEGLREVASKINAVGQESGMPGLYTEIRDAGGKPEDFIRATRAIVEAVQPEIAAAWDAAWVQDDLFPPLPPAGSVSTDYPEQTLSAQEQNRVLEARQDLVRDIDQQLAAINKSAYQRAQAAGGGYRHTPEEEARVKELEAERAERWRQFDAEHPLN